MSRWPRGRLLPVGLLGQLPFAGEKPSGECSARVTRQPPPSRPNRSGLFREMHLPFLNSAPLQPMCAASPRKDTHTAGERIFGECWATATRTHFTHRRPCMIPATPSDCPFTSWTGVDAYRKV